VATISMIAEPATDHERVFALTFRKRSAASHLVNLSLFKRSGSDFDHFKDILFFAE
jgi:hypothetical protein